MIPPSRRARSTREVPNAAMNLLHQDINNKIAELAYFKAEKRGIGASGEAVEDWLEAEREVLSSIRNA